MTGSQFQKSARATSSSPKLKYPNPNNSYNKAKIKHPESLHSLMKPKEMQAPLTQTPAKNAKRSHQAIVSPITLRSESASPKAKFPSLSRPLTFSPSNITSRIESSELVSLIEKISSYSAEEIICLDSPLAVPKVSAEPPSPLLLPNPPKHWVGESNVQCLAKKQQCKEVTNCLMTHLTSSGILISAQ